MGSKLRNLWLSAGGIAPDDWEFISLEDLLLDPKSMSVGVMYPGKHTESGVPLIKVGDVKSGVISSKPESYISNEVDEEYKRTRLKGSEMLITLVGNPGDCVIVTDKMIGWNAARALAVLTLKDPMIRSWLRIVLLSSPSKHIIDSRLNTTVQKTLNLKDIRELPIPLPPTAIRERLCFLNSTFEKKILLNQQTNQTLEQMAQTLFKSWFVDFDPVFDNLLAKIGFDLTALPDDFPDALLKRAKKRLLALVKGRQEVFIPTQEHGNESEPLPHPDFPSEFEYNEQLGWIPKGWESKSVSQVIQVNPRTSLPKGTVVKFADMKTIPTSGYMVDEIIEKEYKGGAKFVENDVLLARITPCLQNGKTALVDFLSDEEVGFGSTEFIVLRENGDVSYPFIACLAREDNFRAHCMQSMVGSSGRQRVQNACFDDYYLALPKEGYLLKRFSELTKPNFAKMTSNKLENQSLTKLRDTLLPKLISGELQIPDVIESDGK